MYLPLLRVFYLHGSTALLCTSVSIFGPAISNLASSCRQCFQSKNLVGTFSAFQLVSSPISVIFVGVPTHTDDVAEPAGSGVGLMWYLWVDVGSLTLILLTSYFEEFDLELSEKAFKIQALQVTLKDSEDARTLPESEYAKLQ
ncbi:hypothetical protein KEM48_004429 [Puccinia striiformis f. sp. tritici PST-130]|nr:hypothetical protein KEM48_004429 [Puccinia striiformis f. sp. tritici PST-130]